MQPECGVATRSLVTNTLQGLIVGKTMINNSLKLFEHKGKVLNCALIDIQVFMQRNEINSGSLN